MFLNFTLSFKEHLEKVLAKFNSGIAILRKLQTVLLMGGLLINRLFVPIFISVM